jgi:hypothetical protein
MTVKDVLIVAVDDHAGPPNTSGPSMNEELVDPIPTEVVGGRTSLPPSAPDHSGVEVEPASGSTVRPSLDQEDSCADSSRGSLPQDTG